MGKPGWLRGAVAAYQRYQADGGDRLAAGITYFGFLSFFPLVALGFAVLGFVVSADSGVRTQVEDALASYLPGLIGGGDHQISLDDIASSKASVGAIGLVGLLIAGLGWINALRQSVREVWHVRTRDASFVKGKLRDLAALGVVGVAVLLSVAVSSAATAVTDQLLGVLGLQGTATAQAGTFLLATAVALLVDTLVLLYLFTIPTGERGHWRLVLPGAVLTAALLEVVKLLGTFLVGRTTSNPLYGTFAVIVGLLVWINVLCRVLLIGAAWTAQRMESLHPAPALAVALPAQPDWVVGVEHGDTAAAERRGRDLGLLALGALAATTTTVISRAAGRGWRLVTGRG